MFRLVGGGLVPVNKKEWMERALRREAQQAFIVLRGNTRSSNFGCEGGPVRSIQSEVDRPVTIFSFARYSAVSESTAAGVVISSISVPSENLT